MASLDTFQEWLMLLGAASSSAHQSTFESDTLTHFSFNFFLSSGITSCCLWISFFPPALSAQRAWRFGYGWAGIWLYKGERQLAWFKQDLIKTFLLLPAGSSESLCAHCITEKYLRNNWSQESHMPVAWDSSFTLSSFLCYLPTADVNQQNKHWTGMFL